MISNQKYPPIIKVPEIDCFISVAEKEARMKVTNLGKESELKLGVDGKPFNWDFYTEFYHAAMNRMTIEKGLRVSFNVQ